jgi:hypothetical protein
MHTCSSQKLLLTTLRSRKIESHYILTKASNNTEQIELESFSKLPLGLELEQRP